MSSPDLFTVTEAAVVLRIGRTTAYELARRDLATGGGEGLGVIRIGGQLRIPRVALERLIGGPLDAGPTDTGIENADQSGSGTGLVLVAVADPTPARVDHPSVAPGRRRRLVSVEQLRFDS